MDDYQRQRARYQARRRQQAVLTAVAAWALLILGAAALVGVAVCVYIALVGIFG